MSYRISRNPFNVVNRNWSSPWINYTEVSLCGDAGNRTPVLPDLLRTGHQHQSYLHTLVLKWQTKSLFGLGFFVRGLTDHPAHLAEKRALLILDAPVGASNSASHEGFSFGTSTPMGWVGPPRPVVLGCHLSAGRLLPSATGMEEQNRSCPFSNCQTVRISGFRPVGHITTPSQT